MILGIALALAGPREDVEQQAQLDALRVKVADQVHLQAYDLIDEMVFRLAQDPVFAQPTPVVVAGVSVPVGLGSGLQSLLENHLTAVFTDNPEANVQLVHCPTCTAVVVHSGPEGTVVSRGVDNPRVIEELGASSGKHALFVDVEAEGTFLVLRARLTRLTPDLPIVWSQTLSSAVGAGSMLRQSEGLKSAAEARQEYLDTIRDKSPIKVPVRFSLRSYARPEEPNGFPLPPFIWLQTGVELAPTQARSWTGSVIVGYSFIPQTYQGVMGQARVARLVSSRVHSYTHPDLYIFAGGAFQTVWGAATASFLTEPFNLDEIINGVQGNDPRSTFGTFQIGADLRVGNRMGLSVFLENLPTLRNSNNLGEFLVIGLEWQSLGTEVTFWF